MRVSNKDSVDKIVNVNIFLLYYVKLLGNLLIFSTFMQNFCYILSNCPV